jgi:hypothetical protein
MAVPLDALRKLRLVGSLPCRLAFGVGALALALLAGCGEGDSLRSEGSHQPARAARLGVDRELFTSVARRCASVDWTPSSSHSYAAVIRRPASVRGRPSDGAHQLGRFARLDQNGYPTIFGVLGARVRGCRPVWLRVRVPSAPNGGAGWVRASEVRVYPVNARIDVDLSSRWISAFSRGRLALRARVAIGAPQTPTPVGRFYVDERFVLSNADGPFGVSALGISAHSEVLQDWVEGGPIALHGTNDPASIGGAVSHGCVRLTNADMGRLFRLAPAGTPVVIHP